MHHPRVELNSNQRIPRPQEPHLLPLETPMNLISKIIYLKLPFFLLSRDILWSAQSFQLQSELSKKQKHLIAKAELRKQLVSINNEVSVLNAQQKSDEETVKAAIEAKKRLESTMQMFITKRNSCFDMHESQSTLFCYESCFLNFLQIVKEHLLSKKKYLRKWHRK